MDCQNLTFPPHSFDVVVSNALLEYLQDVGSFFQGARQLLKPGGVMICGTKNLLLSLKKPDGTPRYNNHLQEFTPEGLAAELGRHFGSVTIFGEQMNSRSEAYIMNPRALRLENQLVKLNVKRLFPRRLRRWVRKLVTGVDLNEIDYEDFEITEQNIESALYLIGTGIKGES
jgi:SAM-dependent methyltransferase